MTNFQFNGWELTTLPSPVVSCNWSPAKSNNMNIAIKVLGVTVASLLLYSCNNCRYPIDDKPTVKVDDRLIGTWKSVKPHSSETITFTRNSEYLYMVAEKADRTTPVEYHTAWLSDVENNLFLNVADKPLDHDTDQSFIFLRILSVNNEGNKICVAMVMDTSGTQLQNAGEVRKRVTDNWNKSTFYADTEYLEKVKR